MTIETKINERSMRIRIIRDIDDKALSAISYDEAKSIARREHSKIPTVKEFIRAFGPENSNSRLIYEAAKGEAYWLDGKIELVNNLDIRDTTYLRIDYRLEQFVGITSVYEWDRNPPNERAFLLHYGESNLCVKVCDRIAHANRYIFDSSNTSLSKNVNGVILIDEVTAVSKVLKNLKANLLEGVAELGIIGKPNADHQNQ